MGKANDGSFRRKYDPDKPRPCTDCGQTLPPESFYAKTRNADGSIRTRGSVCRECHRDRQRKRHGHGPRKAAMTDEEKQARSRELYLARMADPTKRERILDATRRYKRKRRAQMTEDPDLHAAYLADERIRYRIRNGPIDIERPAIEGYDEEAREWVDAEPFIAYLNQTFGAFDTRDLEPILKIDSHRLNDLRRQRRVSLSVVDHVLTAGLGRPDLLNALYPLEGGS